MTGLSTVKIFLQVADRRRKLRCHGEAGAALATLLSGWLFRQDRIA